MKKQFENKNQRNLADLKVLSYKEMKNVLGGVIAPVQDCVTTDKCSTGCGQDHVCNTCCYA
ncbi:MAG: hypothetical protein EOO20_04045 [Chryseobacterium sp.]|nr:MAG: hypothetical protein EOO20_04045 [Chryseobacterium sp.]